MRLLLPLIFSVTLFGQPEIFILPLSGSLITPATQEPFTTLSAINTRNVPAYFFQNAEGTKYYSVGRTQSDTVVVLDATNPSVVLARLNLSAATIAVLSPDRRRLLVGGSAGLHIIDTATDTVVATINGPAPVDIGVSLDGRRAYVLTDQLTTISLVTNTPVSILPIAKLVTGLAVNYTGLIYVSAQDRLYEITDAGSPSIRREFHIPGRPGRLSFTPDGRTGLAINQTPETGFSILRFDLVHGGLSGGIQNSNIKLDSLFLTEPNGGFAYSAQTQTPYQLTIEPLSVAESPLLINFPTGYLSATASSEFPRARTLYFSSLRETMQNSTAVRNSFRTGLIFSGGRVVSAPPSFTGTPAHLYAFNGDQTSGSLPLIVRVTDNVGRSLRDVRVQASSGDSAISNADGWAIFHPPATLGAPITVTAGSAKAIFRLGSPSQTPATVGILAGQGQMGRNSLFYPSPFRIVVRDAAGFPVVDQLVQFSLSAGVGRLDCQATPVCTLRTDANGQAELGFVPGFVPKLEYYQQQQITVAAGNAPRRTIFITTVNSFVLPALGRVAPVQRSLFGVVNTVLPDAIQINTLILEPTKLGQSVPNVGLSIAAPLQFPDISCEGESGVVLTDAAGLANCPLRLGSRPGLVDLTTRINMAGSWSQALPTLQLEIAPVDVPALRFVRGREQTVSRGGISTPIVVLATDRFGQSVFNQALQWTVDPPVGLVLQNPATATDSAGEASATVLAGSSPGTYTVRALSNGLSVATIVYIGGTPFLSSTSFSVVAEPNVVGITITPNPAGSGWTVQGLPSWIRTPTPAGTGIATIWLSTSLNPSLTDSRGATFTIGGILVGIGQRPGVVPVASLNTPSSTSGSTGTFQAFYGGANALYFNVLNLLIRDSLDGRSACYVAFSVPLNKLYLVGDSGPETLLPPITIPSQESVSNSQCTILGIESSPPFLDIVPHTLRLRIAFAPSFSGSKIVYAGLSDIFGRASGWTIVGTHQVPPGPATFPRPVSVSPAVTTVPDSTLSFAFEDQTDARNIETAWILINDALDGRRACSIAYHRPSNQIFLIPDSGVGAEASSMPLSGTGSLSNSQCAISASGAVVSQTGNRLTVTLPISFRTSGSTQTRAIWTAVQTLTGQRSNWQALGTVRRFF